MSKTHVLEFNGGKYRGRYELFLDSDGVNVSATDFSNDQITLVLTPVEARAFAKRLRKHADKCDAGA